MNKTKQKGVNTFKERLRTLKLTCLEEINEDFNVDKKYKLKDIDGYLYSFSSSNLCTTMRRNGTMATFFNSNPYTYVNINNYFKLNNIDLELVTKEPKNAIEKLEFRCIKHNEVFKRCWNSVLSGLTKCCICTGMFRHDIHSIRKYVEDSGCKFLSSEYCAVNKDYEFECSCGNRFIRRMDVFMYEGSTMCPECMGINICTYEKVKKDLKDHGIEMISREYKNSYTNIEIKYNCGFTTNRTYTNIKDGNYKCPHCNKKGYGRNTEQFYKEVKDLVGNEYVFEGEYINCDAKMYVTHSECGHKYEITPHKFINGNQRCPVCTGSKCEESISKYLMENKISFKIEYSFDGLIGIKGGLLRFDFALKNFQNELFLIEYDGEYHYKPIEGEEKLKIQQEHDRRKDNYCKNNNIKLYRIPYWEQDNLINKLEEILTREGLNG